MPARGKKDHLIAPDISAEERYIHRSMAIRAMVHLFLQEASGSTWASMSELHARAGNYANSSIRTAERWVFQYTRVNHAEACKEVRNCPGFQITAAAGKEYYMLDVRRSLEPRLKVMDARTAKP